MHIYIYCNYINIQYIHTPICMYVCIYCIHMPLYGAFENNHLSHTGWFYFWGNTALMSLYAALIICTSENHLHMAGHLSLQRTLLPQCTRQLAACSSWNSPNRQAPGSSGKTMVCGLHCLHLHHEFQSFKNIRLVILYILFFYFGEEDEG